MIAGLCLENGEWCSDQGTFLHIAVSYFQNLFSSDNHNPYAKVVDMLDVAGNWDFDHFEWLLPLDLRLRIAVTRPPEHGLIDRVLWTRTENGRFQVRSAYELRKGVQLGLVEPVWDAINRFRGLPKVQTFLWLVSHYWLLTNAERVRRHMTNDSSCALCGFPFEDIDHVLRHCPVATSIWSQFVRLACLDEFLAMERKQWILVNLTDACKFIANHIDWDILFGSILWNIWLRRNDYVFNGGCGRHESIVQTSLRLQQECIQTMGAAVRSSFVG
ncbi:hypothetical protein V6N11_053411 [Hibiscus sabdariffa]|uniref:Reverse transcriptase zinc-binding domain-containing protein n=1 Tax=Hibiscus sabdariffa TaxID=183260 RepID=A0ABR2UDM2_9ROSI